MIVGGTSQDRSSSNVIGRKTGFAYALDLDGNWMWSQNFMDGTETISEVNQVVMNTQNTAVVLYGMMDVYPAIIELDSYHGTVMKNIYIGVGDIRH